MSSERWILEQYGIEPGQIQATVRQTSTSEPVSVTIKVEPPEPAALQRMMEQLSMSAVQLHLLLSSDPDAAGEDVAPSGKAPGILSLQSLVGQEEDTTILHKLLSFTPYIGEAGPSWTEVISAAQLDDDSIVFVLDKIKSVLEQQPLLAWTLAGRTCEQVLEQVWTCWRNDMPAAPLPSADGQEEEQEETSLSDEPSLGSLLAEAAAAGNLHQVGEGLADVQAYLDQADIVWQPATKSPPVFGTDGEDKQQLPQVGGIVPEVKPAMDGYEEIRRRVAERIKQRQLTAQRGKK
ncbi:hypothetical protein [Paenibacillus sp. WLX2291]|uniref:hypothetical protein n=1 Tax=Paenibacillus sp. WLX2291 TaxID=3296934 RepID=UPI0039845D8A